MTTLTVATWNVYLGADLALLFAATSLAELAERAEVVRRQQEATDFAQRAEAIARVLARDKVDVVGLQEITRWESAQVDADGAVGPPELLVDFLPLMVAACEATGTPYDVHAVNHNFAGGLPVGDRWMSILGANVILVRRGGRFTVTGEETRPYDDVLEMRTGIDGVTFPIARSWGAVGGVVGGHRVTVANTHTEAYDAAVRDAQRDQLLATLDRTEGPVIVLGDLNAAPKEVGVPAPYQDAWIAAGGDPDGGLTCGQGAALDDAESLLSDRIDYVLVRGAAVLDCHVVGDQQADRTTPWPSDHAGVVARLQFQP